MNNYSPKEHPDGCPCDECIGKNNPMMFTQPTWTGNQYIQEPEERVILEDKRVVDVVDVDDHRRRIVFDLNDPYEKAAYELIKKARNLRKERITKRGKDYETVWQKMELRWHTGIICTKCLRLDDAVEKGLTEEINENLVDILNYLIFAKHEVMKNENED